MSMECKNNAYKVSMPPSTSECFQGDAYKVIMPPSTSKCFQGDAYNLKVCMSPSTSECFQGDLHIDTASIDGQMWPHEVNVLHSVVKDCEKDLIKAKDKWEIGQFTEQSLPGGRKIRYISPAYVRSIFSKNAWIDLWDERYMESLVSNVNLPDEKLSLAIKSLQKVLQIRKTMLDKHADNKNEAYHRHQQMYIAQQECMDVFQRYWKPRADWKQYNARRTDIGKSDLQFDSEFTNIGLEALTRSNFEKDITQYQSDFGSKLLALSSSTPTGILQEKKGLIDTIIRSFRLRENYATKMYQDYMMNRETVYRQARTKIDKELNSRKNDENNRVKFVEKSNDLLTALVEATGTQIEGFGEPPRNFFDRRIWSRLTEDQEKWTNLDIGIKTTIANVLNENLADGMLYDRNFFRSAYLKQDMRLYNEVILELQELLEVDV